MALGEKIAECKQGVKTVSELMNPAYYVVQADTNMQVLVQELVVKEEKETEEEGGDCSAGIVQEVGQFAYKALRPAKGVLILVAEPFDANNPITLPSVLQISAK
ncbi:hypothetical protein IWW48_000636 [Coemansia sp. RSA 1200]|nr:hypothetical protein IWW48_000636 [Coemansia sp. RSA 1200]